MFVLDTNVLSAIMGARPAPEVAAWIAGQPEDALFTTTIFRRKSSQASQSCRKAAAAPLLKWRLEPYRDDFNRRVLPFDAAAAAAYAEIYGARRRAGRPTAPLDLMIAAVARANGAGWSRAISAVSKTAASNLSIRGRPYDQPRRTR